MSIKLGYNVPDGEPVSIDPSHLIVTGVTQKSGKTTTVEALISRSGKKAIVFRTKPGEKGITRGTKIRPFFRERSDYRFVKNLIEASSKEKLKIERGTLMRLCKGTGKLEDIQQKVQDRLAGDKGKKPTGLKLDIFTILEHYLENVIPQIRQAELSRELALEDGVNIMDLEELGDEVQSLVISSVADEVLNNHTDTVLVIPEAWKFLPQRRGNPCKQSVEAFIRQGATNGNLIWIDSQDMSGVDKQPLKQVSTWLLGYQSERNEVKHTINQISLPKKQKPSADEVMQLGLGQFFLSERGRVEKVYVQPSWLNDESAEGVAEGKWEAISFQPPEEDISEEFEQESQPKKSGPGIYNGEIEQLRNEIKEIRAEIEQLKQQPEQEYSGLDTQVIVREVLEQLPERSEGKVVQVNPIEKLKQEFLEDAKQKVQGDIQSLDEEQERILKYVESLGKRTNLSQIMTKCFDLNTTGGASRTRLRDKIDKMVSTGLIRKDNNSRLHPNLIKHIDEYLSIHDGTDQQVQQVYDRILYEMLEDK